MNVSFNAHREALQQRRLRSDKAQRVVPQGSTLARLGTP